MTSKIIVKDQMATTKVSGTDAMNEVAIHKWLKVYVTDEISCSHDTAEEAKYFFNETNN